METLKSGDLQTYKLGKRFSSAWRPTRGRRIFVCTIVLRAVWATLQSLRPAVTEVVCGRKVEQCAKHFVGGWQQTDTLSFATCVSGYVQTVAVIVDVTVAVTVAVIVVFSRDKQTQQTDMSRACAN